LTDVALETRPSGATDSPVLVADQLHKGYHISRTPRQVIVGVSLTIGRGEFVAIMGQSGCGKSTLLHILGGLEPPDSGRVVIDGIDLYSLDDERLSAFRRDHLGFVFQFFNLIPSLTAAENVALPLRLRGSGLMPWRREDRQVIKERVAALMDQLDLHGLQGHGPEEISGGEQQRIAIARALATAPALLLADEPTGNVDYATAREVMGLLNRLCRSQRQTTVLVTHDARTAAYADRVLVMRDGAVVAEVALDHSNDREGSPPEAHSLIARLAELGL
jgi:putative ABC transport system ATP-binding protein